MRVTCNWLAEFVAMEWPLDRLTDRLTTAGFEVEAVEAWGRDLPDVVCVEVVRVEPHPRAEGLSVCAVRADDATLHTVVCGAPNVRVGMRVPWARPGAMLPDGRPVAALEVHGFASAGMLCSEAELGLGGDARGLLVLPDDARPGRSVTAALGIEDTVLDIAITPNRGDCLSIVGLAREIAALTGQRPVRPRVRVSESDPGAVTLATIQIADADLCGRYVGRVVADVGIGPAPLRMQARLRAVGVRPINNVVDVTNYVMIERGQPLHAFDYDRLPRPEIVVRRAGQAGTFTTLDGHARALLPNDLLITSGGETVAIAGIMGGADSEVTETTRRILLESAWFDPAAVRRTAKRLGLRTEASYRFERCTDIEGVETAADRAAELMANLAGGRVLRGCIDVYPGRRTMAAVPLRLKRLEELLGMTVGRAEVVGKLKALGVAVTPGPRGTLSAVPPSYRPDLTREIDFIEEVVRLIGYDNVPTTFPSGALTDAAGSGNERTFREIRRYVAGQGLHEAVFLAFASAETNRLFPGIDPEPRSVRIVNPLTQDDTELRRSLCGQLVRAVRDNLAYGATRVALFSIGKVFWRDDEFREAWRVAGVVCRGFPGTGLGRRDEVELVDIKGVVDGLCEHLGVPAMTWQVESDRPAFHPGQTAAVIGPHGGTVGIAGALHPGVQDALDVGPRCWLFELDLTALLQYFPPRVKFAELPRFPAVVRDVAFVVDDDFASDRLTRFLRGGAGAGDLVEEVLLFDQYVGAPIPSGKKSLAYTVSYRAADRTLTDAEVSEVHARLIAAAVEALHVDLR